MQELSGEKMKAVHKSGQNVSGPLAPKKGGALFSFFSSTKGEIHEKDTSAVLRKPILKSSYLSLPRADLPAVKNWVALEEKIVHDYKEQKTARLKSAAPSSATPAKQVLPAFETFSTQTVVSSSSGAPKLKDPVRGSRRTFFALGKFLLVLGWFAAGASIFLYVQETFLSRETSQKLFQVQNEKSRLKQSYDALRSMSEDQSAEIAWLNNQLKATALELRTAKADKVTYEQRLEKKYREELMRITVRYESELAVLQGAAQTRSALNAPRARGQVLDKIVDQAGMSALSGAAAGLSQERLFMGETSVLPGKVVSINGRQGFVVISMGAAQGAGLGRWITISRNGRELAAGRIDRVYPTMSVAVLRNTNTLGMIQEGDSVSFS